MGIGQAFTFVIRPVQNKRQLHVRTVQYWVDSTTCTVLVAQKEQKANSMVMEDVLECVCLIKINYFFHNPNIP